MIDKKTFGSFIKSKRTEKNYSQKDLAEMLFVSEGAVSKWERGVSYPDITLISDICRVLEISEHELITASTDMDTRKMKQEARKFRTIRDTWFWVPTISYVVALLTCFICNLAINHTLSWFFIVLTALICAYSFVPTISSFFEKKKLLIFTVTSYLSICLLLFTCAAYTDGLYWLPVACIGTLMGYILIFGPILLSRTKLSRFKFVMAFTAVLVLTILILLCVYSWKPFMLGSAILITIYAYFPVIFCAVICMFSFDGFFKASICMVVVSCAYYCIGHVTNALFGLNENHYEVDFHNWAQCVTGNVHLIVITAMLFIGVVLFAIGFLRIRKDRK